MRVPGTRSDAEGKQASEFDDPHSHDPNEAELWPERDFGGWKLKVLALAGAVIIPPAIVVELLSLMDGGPLPPPPTIGAAPGSVNVQPSSDENIATSGDVGATLSKESAQSAHVKVVSSKEQPIDLAQALPAGSPWSGSGRRGAATGRLVPRNASGRDGQYAGRTSADRHPFAYGVRIFRSQNRARRLAVAGRDADRDTSSLCHGLGRDGASD